MNSPDCLICCRPANNPFRVYGEDGKIQLGCVDACHGDQLRALSESFSWHARNDAKAIRRALTAGLSSASRKSLGRDAHSPSGATSPRAQEAA
jgi:hypothetical protein